MNRNTYIGLVLAGVVVMLFLWVKNRLSNAFRRANDKKDNEKEKYNTWE